PPLRVALCGGVAPTGTEAKPAVPREVVARYTDRRRPGESHGPSRPPASGRGAGRPDLGRVGRRAASAAGEPVRPRPGRTVAAAVRREPRRGHPEGVPAQGGVRGAVRPPLHGVPRALVLPLGQRPAPGTGLDAAVVPALLPEAAGVVPGQRQLPGVPVEGGLPFVDPEGASNTPTAAAGGRPRAAGPR